MLSKIEYEGRKMINMNKYKKVEKSIIIFIILFFLILSPNIKVGAESEHENIVNIYFFHSNTCSHCKSEALLLDKLEKKYENVNIYRYEISIPENNAKRKYVQDLYDIKTHGVPLTIIGSSAYSGYNEEKSSIQFVKTIEYYSKYGYEDKVGEYFEIPNLPSLQQVPSKPTLEEFMEEYANYKLFSTLSTNDFDLTTNSYLLGIKSQCNILNISSILLFLLLLHNIKDKKEELKSISLYIGTMFLWIINMTLSNYIFSFILIISTMIIIVSKIIRYSKTRKRSYLVELLFIFVAIITIILENVLSFNEAYILKEMMSLYNPSNIEIIICYLNYILTTLLFELILIILLTILTKKLFQIKSKIIKKEIN